jgi:heptosyltransferase-2
VTPPSRLVILAPNWLGDAVMALPLIADVRRAWPEAAIVVAARRSVAPLFAMVSDVTSTITLAGSGGWRGLSSLRENASTLAAGAFDAALLLPNSFQAAWLASRARIPERWGYSRDVRGRLLTRVVSRPARRLHQADYYQALGEGLGLEAGERYAQVIVDEAIRARARTLLGDAGLRPGQRYVVLAPGAAYGRAKQWLPPRFAELSSLLANRGVTTVMVGADADRAACAEVAELALATAPAVASGPAATVLDVSGRTDLPLLAGVMAEAAAVVANDSGAMHLAAAAGAHVVAVFGPTDDRQTSPLRAHAAAPAPTIIKSDVWCRPCMLRECPIDHRCMAAVSAGAVLDALAKRA